MVSAILKSTTNEIESFINLISIEQIDFYTLTAKRMIIHHIYLTRV